MKAWTLSLALLLAPPAAAGELSGPCSKLDLLCGDAGHKIRWMEFKPAEGRYKRNAVTLRFGDRSAASASQLEVQVGGVMQRALFLAAVVAALL